MTDAGRLEHAVAGPLSDATIAEINRLDRIINLQAREVERLRRVVREWGQLLIADGELTLDDVRAALAGLEAKP